MFAFTDHSSQIEACSQQAKVEFFRFLRVKGLLESVISQINFNWRAWAIAWVRLLTPNLA